MTTANDNDFTDKAYFCPGCGSAMVDIKIISDETSCGVCNWHGKVQELAAMPFSQEMGSPEQILQNLSIDIRQFLSKDFAVPYIKLLSKWGFLGLHMEPKEIARYMGATAKAIALSLIQTRQEIEKERS